MSPHSAIRRNGTCTGSLWKSHSRSTCATSTPQKDCGGCSTAADKAAFSLDGILAEANERQRAHEFCVLVGNTMWSYSDVWAYTKGDSPAVSSCDELFIEMDMFYFELQCNSLPSFMCWFNHFI